MTEDVAAVDEGLLTDQPTSLQQAAMEPAAAETTPLTHEVHDIPPMEDVADQIFSLGQKTSPLENGGRVTFADGTEGTITEITPHRVHIKTASGERTLHPDRFANRPDQHGQWVETPRRIGRFIEEHRALTEEQASALFRSNTRLGRARRRLENRLDLLLNRLETLMTDLRGRDLNPTERQAMMTDSLRGGHGRVRELIEGTRNEFDRFSLAPNELAVWEKFLIQTYEEAMTKFGELGQDIGVVLKAEPLSFAPQRT